MHLDEATPRDGDNLGNRAVRAIGWKSLSQGVTTGLQMLTGIILARLLMPADFGILGMATMVTSLTGILCECGLGQALVQRQRLEKTHLAAAYWGEILLGVGLTGILLVVAPFVGLFFKEPRMVPVLRVLALTFLVTPLGAIPNALLQRRLDFRRQFFASLAGSLAYATVGLTMALRGYGYWSLAGALLASAVANALTICVLTRQLPPPVPSFTGLRDLWRFGLGVTGVGIFNYLAQQADYFVVGRWLDSAALGLYTRAFMLVHQPLALVGGILSPVLFPVFAQLRETPAQARAMMGRVLTTVAMLTFPFLVLFGVTAPQLIPLLFGKQWEASILPAQILTFAGMLRTLVNPSATLPKAFGAVHAQAWLNGIYCVALASLAIVGTRWGIVGVAYGVLGATFLVWLLNALLLYSCSGFGAADYFRSLRGPGLCSLTTLAASWLVRSTMTTRGDSPVLVLGAALAAGLGAAALLTYFSPFTEHRAAWQSLLCRLSARHRERQVVS